MSDERSGSFGLCTLGYSSSGWGHWPLIDAGVALWDAEFLLAQRSSGVTGAAEQGAEFSLAEQRFLLLLDFLG